MTGDESWFYYRKIPSKQDSNPWASKANYPSTEAKRQQHEAKTIFVILFMATDPLLIHQVPARTSLDAMYYRDECLKVLVKNLHKKRPTSTTNDIKLYHDNARPRVKDIILTYLQAKTIKVMTHLPYSSDLASSDFRLFNTLKRSYGSYADDISLGREIATELKSIPRQEYQKTFKKMDSKNEIASNIVGTISNIYYKNIIKMPFSTDKYSKMRELID